jgi:hypothetical protein
MKRGDCRPWSTRWSPAGLLLVGMLCAPSTTRAQSAQYVDGQAPPQLPVGAQAQRPPSAQYSEQLRRTVERRRQRRALKRQGQIDPRGAVGAIVPWPMPPALIIRHTPAVHSEVDAFLYVLRR